MLKTYSSSLAEALSGREGGLAVELMHKLGVLTDAEAEAEAVPIPSGHPGAVGLWEPVSESGRTWFERSAERSAEWSLWADVQRIEPRGSRRRVVLLGESVARGYFYDPCYTPARVLEEILSASGVPGGVEVVDLAKNDLQARDLEALLRPALALQPDAFVVFGGNNWAQAPSAFQDGPERYRAAEVLREQGVAGFKAHLEQNLTAQVEAAVRDGLVPLSRQLAVVLMVPEFNLADWRLDGEADAPWLAGSLNERWNCLLETARDALAGGRLVEAEAHARELLEIDGGTAASGLILLAECSRRQGRMAEARAFLERARDAHAWDSTPQVPKTLSAIQEAFRKGAAAEPSRIALVDLPRVFGETLRGELPDRRLFLDYCHLTSLGIRTAMAAVAERLLPVLGAGGASREELQKRAAPPDAATEAEAYFAAAIHNAHWGQPHDIVRHHCDQALAASREIAQAMACYLDLQTRRAPSWACESFAQLSTLGIRSLRRYVSTYSQGKLFDAILLEAIAGGLEAAGVPSREQLAALRREERGVAAGRPVDFLDPYYRSSWADRSGLWWSSFFQRVYDSTSRFPLVCHSTGEPVALELTWRTPAAGEGGAEGAVLVNGSPVANLRPSSRWITQRLPLAAGLLQEGMNTIEIRWPVALGRGEAGIERAASDLERGLPFILLPAFAEIHAFRAFLEPISDLLDQEAGFLEEVPKPDLVSG
jgi:hypothetical protein